MPVPVPVPVFASNRSVCLAALLLFSACSDDGSTASGSESGSSSSTSGTTSATTTEPATSASSGMTSTTVDPTMSSTGMDSSTGDAGSTTGPIEDPTAQGQWQPFASLPAGPRQETAVVAAGGQLYVLGGFMGTNVVDLVEVYDPGSDSWSEAASLPAEMHHVNAAVVAGRIYVTGFLQTLSFTPDGRSFVYDPGADSWSDGTALPTGREVGSSGVAVVGSRIYVYGGLQGSQPVAEAQYYDVDADVWVPIADLPSARDHLVGLAVDGRVYAVGGRSGGIGAHSTDLLVYNEPADTWDALAPMPTSRGGMAGAVLRGWIFIAGGEGSAMDASGVFDEYEAYDPVADEWVAATPMLTPRHGTGAATIADRLYVPGGAVSEGFGPTDVSEVWIPR